MSVWESILNNLPEVKSPTQKKLSFKEKLKWTLLILAIFYVFGMIPLFGLGNNSLKQFETLSIILGASFGSIISLGIGPIVTASIVLQLLNGSGLFKFDLHTPEGRKKFQGIQKIMSIFFIIFEAVIYVYMGGLTAIQGPYFSTLQALLVFQLFLGGTLILFMDEVISKWGFGSGISLFIAAGVSQQIFIRSLSWLRPETNPQAYVGAIPEFFRSLATQNPQAAGLALAGVLATVLVFVIAVYTQAMKIEIPLSFGRIRGYGMRWPLKFMYTSNIPVILIAALLANIQLWARLLANWGYPLLGQFSASGQPISGIVTWVFPPNIVDAVIKGSIAPRDITQALVYMAIMMIGAVIFAWFWMQTAGMDPRTQAENIMESGLQIPGFRKDIRVLERLLARYIYPLTVLGAIAVGFLAAVADLTGALSGGTGILLAVMIVYQLYEEIAKQHMMDMHPMMRKFME